MSNRRFSITALAYDRKGKLLSVGRNSYVKTHPLQAHYAKVSNKPHAVFLHAEIAALVKARGKVYKMVVTRFNSKGQPVLARPCSICQLALKDYGVKEIQHT